MDTELANRMATLGESNESTRSWAADTAHQRAKVTALEKRVNDLDYDIRYEHARSTQPEYEETRRELLDINERERARIAQTDAAARLAAEERLARPGLQPSQPSPVSVLAQRDLDRRRLAQLSADLDKLSGPGDAAHAREVQQEMSALRRRLYGA
jgi:hypothetical protein